MQNICINRLTAHYPHDKPPAMTKLIALTTALAAASVSAAEWKASPYAYANIVAGHGGIDEAAFATHAHDPNDEFTLQGVEIGTKLTYGEIFSSLFNANIFHEDNQFEIELEEAYAGYNHADSGLSFRAGRMLSRTTENNHHHVHAWDFAQSALSTARFMGDEGLLTNSVELTWKLPVDQDIALSFGFGESVPHDHGHEEEHHDDEVHGEGALFDREIYTLRLSGVQQINDFHAIRYGAHIATGKNFYNRTTKSYSANLGYEWRENGFEAGGRVFDIGAEWVKRDISYRSEDGTSAVGNTTEDTFAVTSTYDFGNTWNLGARYEYVEGSDVIEELPKHRRYSLALTKVFSINDYTSAHVRLQANHDINEEFGSEDSIWLQFQFNWGKGH